MDCNTEHPISIQNMRYLQNLRSELNKYEMDVTALQEIPCTRTNTKQNLIL